MSAYKQFAMSSGKTLNPTNPTKNPYYSEDLTIVILDIRGQGAAKDLRAYTSYGECLSIQVGELIDVVSSAPSARPLGHIGWKGQSKVVGIVRSSGSVEGEIPAKALTHWVAK